MFFGAVTAKSFGAIDTEPTCNALQSRILNKFTAVRF